MRRLVWLGIVFAVLWSGWWFFAASGLQSGLTRWFEDRRSDGWQAEIADTALSGFPLKLDVTLERPMLADPETGVAFEASTVMISAPTYWPGYVSLFFPQDEMLFASPSGRSTLTADTAVANLRLHPGATLEVEELALTSGPWRLDTPGGSLMSAQGLSVGMRQDVENANRYAVTLDAPSFQPGSVPRAALRIPTDWPIAFDSLTMDMTATFDRPFDRSTLETQRPQPRRIDLSLAQAAWGTLLLRGAADLDVSTTGAMTGEISLQAKNWQDMLVLAETAGILPPALQPQAENILQALARGSGNPNSIDVTLSLRDGTIFLGFIPLGQAPLLILR